MTVLDVRIAVLRRLASVHMGLFGSVLARHLDRRARLVWGYRAPRSPAATSADFAAATAILRRLASRQPPRYEPRLVCALARESTDLPADRADAARRLAGEAMELALAREADAPGERGAVASALAEAWHAEAVQLTRAGQGAAAVEAAQRTVTYREAGRVAGAPRALPMLGHAYWYLGTCLDHVGRHEEAITALRKSVAAYERFPLLRRGSVVMSVEQARIALCRQLTFVKQFDEAATVGRTSVEFLDLMARMQPRRGIPSRAFARDLLAFIDWERGHRDEAVTWSDLAIVDYRRRQGYGPDLTGLAIALVRRSEFALILGQQDHVWPGLAEALQLCRRAGPAEHASSARSLDRMLKRFANHIDAAGTDLPDPTARTDEADQAAEGRIALLQEAAEGDPAGFIPELRDALAWQAARLSARGRSAEATVPGLGAVELAEALARDDPDRHAARAAEFLSDQARYLGAAGRESDALPLLERAVALRRLATDFDGHRELAMALQRVGACLQRQDLAGESVAWITEAAGVLRSAVAQWPDFRLLLAVILAELALLGQTLDQPAAAVTVSDECVAVCQDLLAGEPPEKVRTLAVRTLVQGLRRRAVARSALGQRDEALTDVRESLAVARPHADTDPDTFAIEVRRSAKVLGDLEADPSTG